MEIDEASLDPLTVARMTDHNVRGGDEGMIDERTNERTTAERPVDMSEDHEAA
ncbi:MAG TPA: hypothetical protein VM598_12175 [Bdellovibrionota bacterium]|nr:hypothetical protein [Bdellovibrionota bacterium]